MTTIVRIQSAAGIGTVAALPLIYIGATRDIPALTVLGFVLFAISMLITPAMRFLPKPEDRQPTAAGDAADEDAAGTDARRG